MLRAQTFAHKLRPQTLPPYNHVDPIELTASIFFLLAKSMGSMNLYTEFVDGSLCA